MCKKAHQVIILSYVPFAYHWGLQKAKEHLSALGTTEPSLPLFDEPKYKPMPEVRFELADEHDIKIDER